MEVLIVKALFCLGVFNALSWLIPDSAWAKLPTWAQASLRLLRSLGPDAVKGTRQGFVIGQEIAKAVQGFIDVFRGGPPMAGLVLALALVACTPGAQTIERHVARGSVLTIAYGVQVADEVCADYAGKLAKVDYPKAIAMAEKCDHGYGIARHGLLFAAKAVDAWDEGSKNEIACAVSDGVEGLREIVSAVESAGAHVDKAIVEDALKAADELVKFGGECKLKK